MASASARKVLGVRESCMRNGPVRSMSFLSLGSAAFKCSTATAGSKPKTPSPSNVAPAPLVSSASKRSLVVIPPFAEKPPSLPLAASTR